MFARTTPRRRARCHGCAAAGGRIGVANWTPESFIGQLFRVLGKHVPPPAGVQPPALWGTEAHLSDLFPGHTVRATKQVFNFRYRSARHWLEVFTTYYGPTHRAFASLGETERAALELDTMALLDRFNIGGSSLVVPSEYLEAVIVKK